MRDLPVECWQEIFEHALHVPIFFDIDPMGVYGVEALGKLADQTAYWESERTRNSMRRVCSSWNHQLDRYAHRFIDTRDVLHGHVPLEALRCAIRILAEGCACVVCRKDHEVNENVIARPVLAKSNDPRLDNIVDNEPMSWKVMIFEESVWSLIDVDLFSVPHRIANVRVAFAVGSLRLFNTQSSNQLTLCSRDWSPLGFIKTQQLIALQCSITQESQYHQLEWPNLRHLQLNFSFGLEWSSVTQWLHKIGPQLYSFISTGSPLTSNSVNPTIWELCPSLEYIGFPPLTRWITPPTNHPVRALRIEAYANLLRPSEKCTDCQTNHRSLLIQSDFLHNLGSTSIRTVVLSLSWNRLIGEIGRGPEWIMTPLICLCKRAKAQNILLVDREWRSFEDWVVSEIEMCKRLGRRIERYITIW